jgi:hypothetical protein
MKITEIQLEQTAKLEKTQTSVSKEKHSKNKEKPVSCKFHLGYLSEREQKQEIPDECIICKDIVECMLKRMRTE